MNAVRLVTIRLGTLVTMLRLKIPLLMGIFFLFSLVVGRVDRDVAHPDVEFLVNRTSVRYLNYNFHITVQPSRLTINLQANLVVTARSTRMIYFVLSNAYRAQINDLKINTYPADVSQEGGLFQIELPFWYKKGDRLALELTYTIENKSRSRRVIAELGANWYPKNILPELVTASFRLDVPTAYTAIANGQLVEVRKLSQRLKRFTWVQLRPTTAFGISVGNYQMLARTIKGRHFRLFFLPGLHRTIQEKVIENAAWLSDLYYTKYGGRNLADLTIVFSDTVWEDTSFGTLIFLRYQTNYSKAARKNLLFNLAHELSHYWWGNQVIPKRLTDWWLVEGFANYSVLLAVEFSEFGADSQKENELLRKWLNQYCQTLLNLRHFKVAELSLAEIGPFDLQRELLYTKGAFVLHMARTQLGKERFDWYVEEFVKQNWHKPVGIDDFARLGAELFGVELVDFLRQWVYSTGTYNLALRDWELIKIRDRYRITLTIANTGQLYLPNLVDLAIITRKKVYRETLRLTALNVKMQKVLPDRPLRVIINARPMILETDLTDNELEIR
ncbi:MAG TPA: M1 family aminopeptidase [Bacillota bacterium]